MRKESDNQLCYDGYYGCDSHCRLRIFRDGATVVAIVTEMPDNPGTSVTNAIEILDLKICTECACTPSTFMLFESYPDQDDLDLVRFHKVSTNPLEFSNPYWKRYTKVHVEGLLGVKL